MRGIRIQKMVNNPSIQLCIKLVMRAIKNNAEFTKSNTNTGK